MPIISTFFGIVIRMFYKEHEPAHFHAEYQGQHAKLSFDGELLVGNLTSATARRLIRDWALQQPGRGEFQMGQEQDRRTARTYCTIGVKTMIPMPSVIRAEHRGGYRLHVTFDDDSAKTIDFRQWLEGPVFEPLKDEAYFRKFFIEGGTVAWPNGADIAPETLYEAQASEEAAGQSDSRQGRR